MKETDFTKAVSHIAEKDQLFRLQLASALLKAAAMGTGGPAKRAAELKKHLPRTKIEFNSEHSSVHELNFIESLVELFGEAKGWSNRVDWVWASPNLIFAVEVKVSSKTRFQDEQLRRYVKALQRTGRLRYGIITLTPAPPPLGVTRPVLRRKGFLGTVLWCDALPLLNSLRPGNPELAASWVDLLQAAAAFK